jgi:hypothetical protein
MQAGRGGTADVPGLQGADRLTTDHLVADGERRADRLVGGAQAAGVRHADHAATGQPAGVDDPPGAGGVDLGGRRRGQIDATMPGQPRLGRWIEKPHDPRHVDRPPEGRRRGRGKR